MGLETRKDVASGSEATCPASNYNKSDINYAMGHAIEFLKERNRRKENRGKEVGLVNRQRGANILEGREMQIF